MLKKVLLGLVALVVILAVVIATRPATFRVERSASIAAPAAVVFAQVNDFHLWSGWSPWEKLDPAMKKTHEGPVAGAGATYAWSGNDQVGEGKMTMLESTAPQRITIKLEFLKPWAATNTTVFTFADADGGTRVTWGMDGNNDFMGKAMCLFMDMDKMIGADFEKGLAAMKTIAEAEAMRLADEAKKKAEADAAAAAAVAAAAAAEPGSPEAAAAALAAAAEPGSPDAPAAAAPAPAPTEAVAEIK